MKNTFVICYLFIVLFFIRCSTPRFSGIQQGRFDTIFFAQKNISIQRGELEKLLDTLIAQKNDQLEARDTVPFLGIIEESLKDSIFKLKLSLFNDHAIVYDQAAFLRQVDGGFKYQDTYFFLVLDERVPPSQSFFSRLSDSIRIPTLRMLSGNNLLVYSSLFFRRSYLVKQGRNLVLIDSISQRIPGDVHVD